MPSLTFIRLRHKINMETIADPSFATFLVGVATVFVALGGLGMLIMLKFSHDDILLQVLSKTAPDAASDELSDSLMTCKRKLNGVRLIITKG